MWTFLGLRMLLLLLLQLVLYIITVDAFTKSYRSIITTTTTTTTRRRKRIPSTTTYSIRQKYNKYQQQQLSSSSLSLSSSFPITTTTTTTTTTTRLHVGTTTTTPTTIDNEKNQQQVVVVVGGGVGGLAIASRIASVSSTENNKNNNTRVLILEKNAQGGGRCGSFQVNLSESSSSESSESSESSSSLSFRHERGPSLLLLPHIYRQLFQDCCNGNKSCEDFGLYIQPCNPAYQVIFDDGDAISVGFDRRQQQQQQQQQINNNNLKNMSPEELQSRAQMNQYEKNGAAKWDAYLQACEAFYNCGLPNFIEQRLDLSSFPAFVKEALQHWGKAWPLKPHSDVVDAFFSDESKSNNKLRVLASFQDLYVGLEPYRNNIHADKITGGVWTTTAPAVFGLLSAIELHPTNPQCGVYAPIGGFQAVTRSLEKLAQSFPQVDIQYSKTVTRITEKGVYYYDTSTTTNTTTTTNKNTTTELQFQPADLVIVNADLPYATQTILNDKNDKDKDNNDNDSENDNDNDNNKKDIYYDWDDRFRFSSGVIAFHWSVNRTLTQLNAHNVFLASNTRAESEQSWSVLRKSSSNTNTKKRSNDSFDGPFNFYVHRASHTDPTAAPEGKDSILVLVPCETLIRNEDYASLPRDEALKRYQNDQFTDLFLSNVRQAVFQRMSVIKGFSDLESQILHEVVDTPVTYADYYNVGAGTPFALSHGFGQLSWTRPGPTYNYNNNNNKNVLFCGASTRPGNGVPLVLIGAKLVAQIAIQKLQQQRKERGKQSEIIRNTINYVSKE